MQENEGAPEVVIDFYSELGLIQSDSCEEITQRLTSMQSQWTGRAALAGDIGEMARKNLELIGQALKVFADEDSKMRYDSALRRRDKSADENLAIDWVSRGWNYYYASDLDAASVAVRRALRENSDNIDALILSAWINIAQAEKASASERTSYLRQAKADSDDAYVLDTSQEYLLDVCQIRGFSALLLGKYEDSLTNFIRAFPGNPDDPAAWEAMPKSFQTTAIWSAMAEAYFCLDNMDEACQAAVYALNKEWPIEDRVRGEARQLLASIAYVYHSRHDSMTKEDLEEKLVPLRADDRETILQHWDVYERGWDDVLQARDAVAEQQAEWSKLYLHIGEEERSIEVSETNRLRSFPHKWWFGHQKVFGFLGRFSPYGPWMVSFLSILILWMLGFFFAAMIVIALFGDSISESGDPNMMILRGTMFLTVLINGSMTCLYFWSRHKTVSQAVKNERRAEQLEKDRDRLNDLDHEIQSTKKGWLAAVEKEYQKLNPRR